MATIKSYTDLEQSKVLAKILKIETADMWWSRCTITNFGDGVLKVSYAVEPCNISQFKNTREDVPCWSLTALLNVLPFPQLSKDKLGSGKEGWMITIYPDNCVYDSYWHDNLVDVCYEMVLKLHELKML